MTSRFDPASIEEGLLLSFEHREQQGVFELVTDVPFVGGKGRRVFARLRFDGVIEFTRYGFHPRFAGVGKRFSAKEHREDFVVQDIQLGAPSGRVARVGFGNLLGGLAFGYESWSAEQRWTVAKFQEDDWLYADLRTGEVVDFYRPFE